MSRPIKISWKLFEPTIVLEKLSNLLPIILMHGLTGTKEYWGDVPQMIADKSKRKVYSYDARNHGETEYSDDFSFDLNVEDLFNFMDTMEIPKAILIGQSMGGQTATNAALRKPERVGAVFSEDMYVKSIPEEVFQKVLKFVRMWAEITQRAPKELNESEAIKFVLDTVFNNAPADSPVLDEKENFYKTKFVLKKTPDGYDVNYNKDVIFRCLENPVVLMSKPSGPYEGPAVFIYGSKSGFNVKSEEAHIKKHFPKAKLIEFPGAAHNVHSEFPQEFVDKVVNECLSME